MNVSLTSALLRLRIIGAVLCIALAATTAAGADDAPKASSDVAASPLSKLKDLAKSGQADEDFLPADKAFRVDVKVRDAQTLVADFTPADSYYLYRDKVSFNIAKSANVSIAKVDLPRGEMKSDPNFGDTEVFHHPFQAIITLNRGASNAATSVAVETHYQGCSEKGLCYPPVKKSFDLQLIALSGDSAAASTQPAQTEQRATAESPPVVPAGADTSGADKAAPESDSSKVAGIFKSDSFWVVVASFFGFGLLLSFTPCVFPMIPILSGIIVGQGTQLTKQRAFAFSAIYVLGMAITYALAGVGAGLSGTLLSNALQNKWVLGTFALVFVALSFSMFGFYDLQLPSSLQSKLTETSNKAKGGTLWGVFIMGVLSALIVGPCVAAPLAGALLYIGQTHNVVLGGSALFAMALGMGVPLLAVGMSAGALLPRAGGWMQSVKNLFGVLLLGLAIWIISPVIADSAHMLLWAALLIVSAIYLHAIDPLPANASGYRKLWKGVGVISLLLGSALLIGAMSGGRDILQPLGGLRASTGTTADAAPHTRFERIASVAELNQRIAATGGKPVMLDFYADWCVSCKEMERFTFADPAVKAQMSKMLLLQADVTANSENDAQLLKRFGLFGPPGILFFAADGKELQDMRVIGFQPADKFQLSLNQVLQAK
ncbi:MAG: protein-disulfide reductase DsbD [Betaproteobacteria bacterium]